MMPTPRVGPAGTATPVQLDKRWPATVAAWFLHCPGQSPAWDHYVLAIVHLRDVDGAPPPVVNVPHATHEVIVAALDPKRNPRASKPRTWSLLRPLNVVEQIQLQDDGQAVVLAEMCALAIVNGHLPAEPPLSGAREPWRTSLLRTSAHFRGEEHAP